MDNKEKTLSNFTTRMRQLILQYQSTIKENKELYEMVDERDKTIAKLKANLKTAHQEYESLKIAKMIEVSDGDIDTAKARIQSILRDVNKCITLLNEQK